MNIDIVEKKLIPLKKELVSHKVYEKINNANSLKIFISGEITSDADVNYAEIAEKTLRPELSIIFLSDL